MILRLVPFAALATLVLCVDGCSLLYENHYAQDDFAIYSDRSIEAVRKTGEHVDQISRAYQRLLDLPDDRVEFMRIVVKGHETNVTDFRNAPDVLGYYVPLFNFISIDTPPSWPQNEEILEQILLHEIAHHFIVTLRPSASSECWLNEGLASNLETALHDGDHFEHPLFNPSLFAIAQRAVYDPSAVVNVAALVTTNWDRFHADADKERHYALSWSLVYFLLEHHFDRSDSLGLRIHRLLAIDGDEVEKVNRQWIHFLRGFDVTDHLAKLAKSDSPETRLTQAWAIRELGRPRSGEHGRALRALAQGIESETQAKRLLYIDAFLRGIERTNYPTLLSADWVRNAVEQAASAIGTSNLDGKQRARLVRAFGERTIRRFGQIPRLIDLLSSRSPAVRASAADRLAASAGKPTITNPLFWADADTGQRAEEIAEWNHWWTQECAHRSTGPHAPERQTGASQMKATWNASVQGESPSAQNMDSPSAFPILRPGTLNSAGR